MLEIAQKLVQIISRVFKKICRKQIFDIFNFRNFVASAAEPGGQKSLKNAIFELSQVWKIPKNENFKNLFPTIFFNYPKDASFRFLGQ